MKIMCSLAGLRVFAFDCQVFASLTRILIMYAQFIIWLSDFIKKSPVLTQLCVKMCKFRKNLIELRQIASYQGTQNQTILLLFKCCTSASPNRQIDFGGIWYGTIRHLELTQRVFSAITNI